MTQEIIIELGILDKIKNVLGKGYNPFRDEKGRFSNSNENKIGSIVNSSRSLISSAIINIKNSVTSSYNGENINLTDEEKKRLMSNINITFSKMKNMVDGIDPNTKINAVASYDEWSKITYSGLFNDGTLLSGLYKNGEIYLSPFITESLSGRSNIWPPHNDFLSLFKTDNPTDDDMFTYAKGVLQHELFHSRDRQYESIMDVSDEDGYINTNKYSMFMEEGSTELLNQLMTYSRKLYEGGDEDDSISDFVNGNSLSYEKEVDTVIAEARNRFPDSSDSAIEFIRESHKKGFGSKGILEGLGDNWSNGNTILGVPKIDSERMEELLGDWSSRYDNREWLLRGIKDTSKLKLSNNKLKLSTTKDYKYSELSINELLKLIEDENYITLKNEISNNPLTKIKFYNLVIRLANKNSILNSIK